MAGSNLNLRFSYQFTVIFNAVLAGFLTVVPLRMIALDQLDQIFFSLCMRETDEFVYIPVANLAPVFH